MNELQLVIAIIAITVLLIIVLILSIVRDIISKETHVKSEPVPHVPEKQSAPNELTTELITNAETKKEHELKPEPVLVTEPEEKAPLLMDEHDIEMVEESQTKETDYQAQASNYQNLPQDSMLRRHYLTHLRAMIEALHTPCPTDSALKRHYDSIIAVELEQCLNDQGAVEQLICKYHDHKNALTQTIQDKENLTESPQAQTITQDVVTRQDLLKLPEDSMLRRHFITHLHAMVEAKMPPRPTDPALRTDYDAMVKAEVEKLLG